jgi:hypothetical protein
MRDGRRQRLGLQTGTEGTVGDTYLDRILSDVEVAGEPNILSLDPDANVRATDQRYLSDAYNYYLGGGFDASQPDFPIQAEDIIGGGDGGDGADIGATTTGGVDTGLTDFEQNLVDQGAGVDTPGGVVAPGEAPLTQEAIDELANYPIKNVTDFPTGDAELASQIAAEDRAAQALADEQADEQALTNLEQARTGQYDTPTETYIGGEKTLEDAGGTYDGFQSAEGGFGLEEGFDEGEITADNYGTPVNQGVDYSEFDDLEADIGAQPIEGLDTEPNLIDIGRDKINEVGQSISEALGTTYDGATGIVEIAGKKINLASAAAKAILNKYVGGPISVVIDALSAIDLPGGPTLQTSKAQSIGLAGEGETQDIYGINTQSGLGDYDQYNIDRVEELETALDKARGKYDTEQEYLNMTTHLRKELKDRQEYNTISGVGGDVEGDQPGMTVAEDIAFQNRVDAGIEAADDDSDSEMLDTPTEMTMYEALEHEEALKERIAQEAAVKAEIDRQNRVKEAEAAAEQRAATTAPVPAHIIGSGGTDYQGGGQGPPSQGGAPTGTAGRNPWGRAKGGLIRKRYSKGGIVDLLK